MECPNCKNQNINLFHDKVWNSVNRKVYQCVNCELLFISPAMTDTEEIEYYKNYNKHVKRRGFTKSDSVADLHKKSQIEAKKRYEIVKNYFSKKKVLEIGSSTGAFLQLIDNCDSYGCEYSDENREFSKQFISGKAYHSID